MTERRFPILVYNPISNHGHLDSWNAIFVALLLETDWRVMVLTPNVPALMSRLALKGVADSPNLLVLDWTARAPDWAGRLRTFLGTTWRRWDSFGDRYYYRRPGSEIAAGMALAHRLQTRAFQMAVPPVFRASHFFYSRLRRMKTGPGTALRQIDPEADYLDPADFGRRVRAALAKAKWKPALILNMYMDLYKTKAAFWERFDAQCRIPWAGIRFVPAAVPCESYYRLPSFRGMCFLEDKVCAAYRAALPAKQFGFLPDITEVELPAHASELANEILRRANGRKIVFMGGSIGWQKNVARWYEMIGLADPGAWFFVQIGEVHKETFNAEESVAYAAIRRATPENLLLKAEYLPDERAFNEIIALSDFIFAVYRDFSKSSNMPSKAANFRKPLLVSDRYLMGERVRQYGIGVAVPEDNARGMLEGLIALARNPVPEQSFQRYRDDFGMKNLQDHLAHFLQDCAGAAS